MLSCYDVSCLVEIIAEGRGAQERSCPVFRYLVLLEPAHHPGPCITEICMSTQSRPIEYFQILIYVGRGHFLKTCNVNYEIHTGCGKSSQILGSKEPERPIIEGFSAKSFKFPGCQIRRTGCVRQERRQIARRDQ